MASTIERFANFVDRTNFEDLPEKVVSETKRLILDTLGCALAGVNSDKGKWAIQFARAYFKGEAQASVIGYGDKLSALGTAFVNAELINALDYDASGKHLPPFVMPPALAVAEMRRLSGKEFITAFAMANEIGIRIGNGMSSYRDVVNGKAKFPPVQGHSCCVYGGTAAVAKLERFPKNLLAQAMSFAGLISPMQIQSNMVKSPRPTTAKYLLAGWAAQAELTAAYLVEAGHRGDVENLDSDYGFWRYAGSSRWDAERVVDSLGEEWRFIKATPFKLYPCCRISHGALDCLQSILEKKSLHFTEIDSIRAFLEASCAEPVFNNRNIEDQTDAQFSVPYNLTVLARGIKPGADWQDYQLLQDSEIRQFMKRVSIEPHPQYSAALKEDPHARMSKIEVSARGKTFMEEKKYIRGTASPDSTTYITDDELITKFCNNASCVLPEEKTAAAV